MRSKKNKKKLIIAIVFGIVAAFSLFNSMNSKNDAVKQEMLALNKKLQEQQLQQQKQNPFVEEKKEVKYKAVVAAKDVKVGDTFVLESLKIQEFEKDELPDEFFKTKAKVVGKIAGKNIVTGGFVTENEIQEADSATIDIPNDTRAITIPVEKFKGLASYIKVGSRVDVLKVANPPEFIAQNIKVVSFEAIVNPNVQVKNVDPSILTSKEASAITFLIPIDLVAKVIDAMFEGQLQVITRNNGDEKILMTEADLPPPPGEDLEISTLPDDVEEELPTPTMPEPDPKKIEFIKASNISTVEFEPGQIKNMNQPKDDSLSGKKLKELLDMVN